MDIVTESEFNGMTAEKKKEYTHRLIVAVQQDFRVNVFPELEKDKRAVDSPVGVLVEHIRNRAKVQTVCIEKYYLYCMAFITKAVYKDDSSILGRLFYLGTRNLLE